VSCPSCHADLPAPTLAQGCPNCAAALAGEAEPGGAPQADELLLAEALEQFEAAAERAEAPELEAFCARYPTIRTSLRQVLSLGRQLARVSRASAAEACRPPETLGRYRILEELGRGGMAPVYRASDPRLGRDVALKLLLPDPARGPARRERFLREARVLARIAHPNVVPIYDVGEEGPWCYLAMELLQGSLDRDVGAQGQTWAEEALRRAGRWVLEAAEGLQHAHERGILHRDVKPANLLLDAQGRVRVADFGLAAVEGSASLTRPGLVVGTPGYAAPEQIRGEAVDVRCDVYGLGATLQALAAKACASQGPVPGPLPERLRSIVARATAADPEQRYPSIAALAQDLRAWLDGQPVRARRRRHLAAALAAAGSVAAALAMLAGRPAPEPDPAATLPRQQGLRVSVSSEVVSVADGRTVDRGQRLWLELREAHGGAALETVQALLGEASVQMARALDAGQRMTRIVARAGRLYVAVESPAGRIEHGWTGQLAWQRDRQGLHELTGDEADALRIESRLDPLALLAAETLRVHEQGPGALDSSDGLLLAIQLADPSLPPLSVLVTGKPGRIAEIRYQAPGDGDTSVVEAFSDYRQVGGVWLAFRHESRRGAFMRRTLIYEAFELLPELESGADWPTRQPGPAEAGAP
jgi:hypothetical protein